jgi:hypothetical protein
MRYPLKLNSALATLAVTGMRKNSYAPPLYRLLWSVGLHPPPPHFQNFGANFVVWQLVLRDLGRLHVVFCVVSRKQVRRHDSNNNSDYCG